MTWHALVNASENSSSGAQIKRFGLYLDFGFVNLVFGWWGVEFVGRKLKVRSVLFLNNFSIFIYKHPH